VLLIGNKISFNNAVLIFKR